MKKIELLSPAGDFEKLRTAVYYGADAVYLGGKDFGLRAAPKNFADGELTAAVQFAHDNGVKVYVTVNVYAENADMEPIAEFLKFLGKIGADAAIVADLGVLSLSREAAPDLPVHVSTQANVTNSYAAKVLKNLGATRIIAARELRLSDVAEIGREVAVEIFAHGAMCVAYSGRCILSSIMAGRSANKGACAQPCRYEYALVEAKREGEYFPIEQDSRGTFLLSSRDLNVLGRIPEIVGAGVKSVKIEGRAKTPLYVATATKAYRRAIDDFYESPAKYRENLPKYREFTELSSHRPFCEGFLFESPTDNANLDFSQGYIRGYDFAGVVRGYADGTAEIETRNYFCEGDEVLFFTREGEGFRQIVGKITGADGEKLNAANVPLRIVKIKTENVVQAFDMMLSKNN